MAVCGLGSCFLPEEKKSQLRASRVIDRQLQKDKTKYRRTVKILLLGSGESGKSTFLKQMRIINGMDFVADELKQFKFIIYGNIVKGMKVLIDAHDKLHISWSDNRNVKAASFIFGYDVNVRLDEAVFQQFVPYIVDLWKDEGIRTAFDRRREFQLGDSIQYFLDDVERIGQMGYTPTVKDVLLARKATKGISEHEFLINDVPFCFVDVGGQRSQRQRWYQCFDNVRSILFLAASSEFDQVLFEDRRTNRLLESCNIFDTIVNNRAFEKVSIILFLNKTDLLQEKIKSSDIKNYFPLFKGNSRQLEDVQRFELGLFDARRVDKSQPLFHHFTTAVDTQNIKFVFQAVKDTILGDHLKTLMLQ